VRPLASERAADFTITDQLAHGVGGFRPARFVTLRRRYAFKAHWHGADLDRVTVEGARVTGQDRFGSQRWSGRHKDSSKSSGADRKSGHG
jgi:hypothetical protein